MLRSTDDEEGHRMRRGRESHLSAHAVHMKVASYIHVAVERLRGGQC